MKIVFCWPEISGYMAACWRALAQRREVELFILAFQSGVAGTKAAFRDDVVRGLPCRLMTPQERQDPQLIASLVIEHQPDVVVLPGWGQPAYMRLTRHPDLARTRFVMGMDTPRKDTWRQRLARMRIGRFLDRMDRVVVAGERSWQYARYLGIPETRLRRGLYGFDSALFSGLHEQRARRPDGWPRRFLYMGRYAPEKGMDLLLSAYGAYRGSVADPWPLTCCGRGALAPSLAGAEGVTDRGFVQPEDQVGVLLEHGAALLPSRYEPWGVAVAEAMAAGLPVVCSEAVGASVELVRPYFSGLLVATGDVASLTRALCWTHEHHAELPEMGRRGLALAAAFGAEAWAQRWAEMLKEL